MPTVQNVARTDAGLASELRVSVMRLRRRLIVEGLPDEALSLTQTSVLACLYRNGDLTVGDLAAFERVQPPSMTRTVKLLESGGYHASRSRHRRPTGRRQPDRPRARPRPRRPRPPRRVALTPAQRAEP